MVSPADQGYTALATAIRNQSISEIRRVGSKVHVTGSRGSDTIEVSTAGSLTSTDRQIVKINGIQSDFAEAAVDAIFLDGGSGADQLTLHDTRGNDRLTTDANRIVLTTSNLRVKAIAFELVRAISEASGTDDEQDVRDRLELRLVGPWT